MEIFCTLGVLIVGALNIVCFLVGARVGQQVAKGQDIKVPTISINPMEKIRERQNRVAAEIEQDKMATIMHNIEAYDGTGAGQKEVPGR